MEKKTIMQLCQRKGMANNVIFIRFFMKRFPNENDLIHSYCNEWIDRFLSGDPTIYMDKSSLKIYKSLI